MHNRIPLSRGLGSSAAATVGGVVLRGTRSLRRAPLSTRLRLPRSRRRSSATPTTRPPSCSAASSSAATSAGVEAVRFDAPRDLRCVLFIPERRLSTEDMRRVLPAEVPLRDAVANLGPVAIGVAGIASGRFELLGRLTVDRLHEPYRSAAYPELPRLTGAAREAGALGAFLSGAGSTVLAFVAPGADPAPVVLALAAAAADVHLDGRTAVVAPRNAGPTISAG